MALKNFLEASKVNDTKAAARVFSVGPYGNRVAFAFQQARAFALAAGFRLWFDENHPKDDREGISLAVLGGGIAGITLMAALHSLGFSRLKLFERKSNVLMDQAYASHRLVHPAYNTWPIADEHASTTRFPFLNWFAGPCDKVVAALRREWERDWAGRFASEAIQLACVVNDVAYNANEDRVLVSYTPYASASCVDRCHFAFAAFGYGVERATLLTEQTSGRYWDMDIIRSAVNDHEKTKFLCVGDGDGALIDCARLSYSGDVFDIATEIMGKLSSDANRPNDIFDWKRTKTAVETRICRAESEAATSPDSPDRIAGRLRDFYIDLVRGLSSKQLEVLNRGLIEPKGFFAQRQVHLVGRGATPFQAGTAPINKLIMAHLINRQIVTYHQGELTTSRNGKRGSLHTQGGCPKFEEFDYRVVRIGSAPPIEEIFKKFKEDHKTKLVQAIGDFSPGIIDPQRFLGEVDQDAKDKSTPGSVQHMEQKEAQIREFIKSYCRNATGRLAGDPEFNQHGGKGVIVVSKHEFLKHAASRLGGYDWHLFGIPIISNNINRHREQIEFGSGFLGNKS